MCIDGSSPTIKRRFHVTVTLSKDADIELSDFKVGVDKTEDGDFPYFDFDETDFRDSVLEQIDIPMPKGWDVEEFEVQKL